MFEILCTEVRLCLRHTEIIFTFYCYRSVGQKAVVTLALADSLVAQEVGQMTIPKDHHLDVQVVERQTLGVFSHTVRKLWAIDFETNSV